MSGRFGINKAAIDIWSLCLHDDICQLGLHFTKNRLSLKMWKSKQARNFDKEFFYILQKILFLDFFQSSIQNMKKYCENYNTKMFFLDKHDSVLKIQIIQSLCNFLSCKCLYRIYQLDFSCLNNYKVHRTTLIGQWWQKATNHKWRFYDSNEFISNNIVLFIIQFNFSVHLNECQIYL